MGSSTKRSYNEQQWWADNDSLDLVKNGRKIKLKNKSYEIRGNFQYLKMPK
jgi:hypothetical protein